MAVPVDVIRLAFWMEVVMNEEQTYFKKSILGAVGLEQFKNLMDGIESLGRGLRISLLHLGGKLPKKCHKRGGSHRQRPISSISEPQFAIEFRILEVD